VAGELKVQGFVEKEFWQQKRRGRTTVEAFLGLGFSREAAAKAGADWRLRIELAEWLALDRVLPSVVSALSVVRSRGFSPVVITARRDPYALRAQLGQLRLESLIDDILIVSPGAPESEKEDCLRRLNAFAFIGDTQKDARAAARAGVPFAAVETGQREPSFLESLGIRPVYSDAWKATEVLIAIGATRPPRT
jgi:phosphoglycolate phosphatase-like HAD superfamily hydrolase